MISVMETDLTFSLATWAPIYYSCHDSWGLCLIWKLAQVFNLHQRVFQVGTLIWIELKGFSNASPKLQLRFCTKWYQIITMLLEGRVVSYVIAWNMIFTRKYIEPWEKNDFRQSAYLDFLWQWPIGCWSYTMNRGCPIWIIWKGPYGHSSRK